MGQAGTGAVKPMSRSRRARDRHNPRFLLVRLSSLGDVINALPAAHALRTSFPDAFLGWVVDPPLAPLLQRSPLLDEVFALPVPNGQTVRASDLFRGPELAAGLQRFVHRLQQPRFDVALELQGLFRSALVARLSKAPVRLGFVDELREANYVFLTRRVAPAGPHAVDRFLSLASAAGAKPHLPSWGSLTTTDDETAAAQLLAGLPPGRSLVALNPGASTDRKRWPADRFGAVADLVSTRTGAVFVVVGSTKERRLAERVCSASRVPVLDLAGRTSLPVLAAVLRRCDCVLTGDTGPMHLAVAVGTTVVALIGPTNPAVTGPYGAGHVVLQGADEGGGARGGRRALLGLTAGMVADAVCTTLMHRQA